MNMAEHSAILIVVLPLFVALLNITVGLWNRSLCYPLVVATLGVCVLLSLNVMDSVTDTGRIHYHLGGWAPPWGIEYVIDHLNAFIALIVSFISFIVAVSSKRSIAQELAEDKITYFYSIYLLLTTGLLGMTLTGDVFNLYVFLEITSLAGYALIAIGDDRAAMASFNYVIMGTVGACFYLLGVGYLYIMTGTLNMADLSGLLPDLYHSTVILAAFAFFVVGVAIKIAFFPLHRWLPDAYTHAPSTVSALVASTMTKVGAYVMIRIMYTVFEPRFSAKILPMSDILGWAAFAAIIAGSVVALAQTNIKRMLSYILVAEVGYIVMGISIANETAFTGAVLHILNDAFMMACLFLVVGAIVYRTGARNISDLEGLGLHKQMPFTMAAFTVAAISMIGIPPTAGFFSKWYLVLGALNAQKWVFAAALLFSSLVNAVLFFRILEKVYFKASKHLPANSAGDASLPPSFHEAPASMLLPICIMAIGILILGFYSGDIISSVIQHAVPKGL